VSHPELPDREVTDLKRHGLLAQPDAALDALDGALRRALAQWDASLGFAAVRAAWMERAGPPGEAMTVQGAQGPLSGYYAGLDEDGALLIELEGGERHRCTYGDVTLS
jgi:BirA family biotin operon repressor/biotin-[acetyl-CoA-carboxylase] ligase